MERTNTKKRIARTLCRSALPSFLLMLLAVWLASAVSLSAQSLGDLARKERARRAATADGTREYTNEDIGAAPRPAPTAAEGEPAEGEVAEGEEAETAEAEEPDQEALEKQYREQFATLRAHLDTEKRRLDVLQRELNLAQMQYYADPNQALREQNTREEINKRMEEIEAQEARVASAQQAIDDLETELRQKSLPPGWARE